MIYVSDVYRERPEKFRTPLQEQVYETLERLAIPFERVDCDEAITMEDCEAINARLQVKTVKTLFLCNRQQTMFYLYVTPGDKPFRTKDFGASLGISRVSFAPTEFMDDMLGTTVGSTTIFSMLLERSKDVRLVADRVVLDEAYYGCTDGTTTGYMRLKTKDVFEVFLPETRREITLI